ncbi:hypothetical protein ACLB1O_14965 [Escherichia coli]
MLIGLIEIEEALAAGAGIRRTDLSMVTTDGLQVLNQIYRPVNHLSDQWFCHPFCQLIFCPITDLVVIHRNANKIFTGSNDSFFL